MALATTGASIVNLKKIIASKLSGNLNEMKVRPPKRRILIEGGQDKLTVVSTPAYSDHPLVVGPRYIPRDLDLRSCDVMDPEWSGVSVWRVGSSRKFASFRLSNPVRSYEINATLGRATDNLFANGKVVEKATYKHVHSGRMAKVLASILASHQRAAFEHAGVRPESEEAYELAKTGLVRTAGPVPFVIYGMSLTSFRPPDFTLELHCVGEAPDVVHAVAHDIGLELKTVAHTRSVRRVRFGPFTLDDALLHKHWTVQHVIRNIERCSEKVNRPDFIPDKPWLREDDFARRVQSRAEDFEAD